MLLAQMIHNLCLWLTLFDLAKNCISSISEVSQAGSVHFKHSSKNYGMKLCS